MKTWLGLLLLSIATLGCGDDTSSGGGAGAGTNTGNAPGTGGDGGTAASCDLETLDTDGVWAIEVTLPVSIEGEVGGPFTTCPTSQQGEVAMLMLMNITSLDPSHSATFAICTLDLPTFSGAAGACADGTEVDLDIAVADSESLPDRESSPITLEIDGDTPGATFAVPALSLNYGADPPLPTWDTADPACDVPGIGNGVCEEACVSNCEVDYYNDDWPGFTWSICGVSIDDTDECNPFDPAGEGSTIQGRLYSTYSLTTSLDGTFTTSCEGTASLSSELLMTLIGGDVSVAGTAANVTGLVNGTPTFTLSGRPATARLVRIDGKYGSADYQVGDLEDTCFTFLESGMEL